MELIEVSERTPELVGKLTEVWERSVRATHTFLAEDEIRRIGEYVPQALGGIARLIVAYEPSDTGSDSRPVGFMGVENNRLEMLFLDPSVRGHGLGRCLIELGVERYGVKELDVNEQNPDARAFYEHMGFVVVSRSPVDDQGRPYPLLTMRLRTE